MVLRAPPRLSLAHPLRSPRPPVCSWWQPRLGRGGRLVFDRCKQPLDRFWAEPGTPEQGDAAADGAASEDGTAAAAGGKDKEGKGMAGTKKDRETAGRKDKEAAAAGDKDKAGGEGGCSPAVKQEPQDGGQPAADGSAAAADGGAGMMTPLPAAALGAAAAPAVASWTWDKPLWEQPNPYAQWLNKSDLASAALTSLAGTPAAIAANPPTTVLKMRSPALAGGVASTAPGGSPAPGSASAATPGPASGMAGTPATTAASRPGVGGAAAGTAGRPPLPPVAAGAAGVHHKATPGTAGSARRDTRRPAKAGQKSNLGPG